MAGCASTNSKAVQSQKRARSSLGYGKSSNKLVANHAGALFY